MGTRRAGATLSQRADLASAPAVLGIGVALAAGLSAWAALTNPFSASADAVTAIALGIVAAGSVATWRRRPTKPAALADESARPRWWPWLVLGAAVLAWELVSFSLGPRVEHPTLSSLYDSATRARPVKGVAFFGWLWLGSMIAKP